ncbi:hypothetical protein [Streptomyces flaveus]|uniref:Lipoprotein n=1 Tax=Streptomyces flaveus TaxID=66370 RepID=A0A917V754_9ACTN|nr:hypothetical protein [Streptomyces flaveus]GGK48037.1 hypothetical protein GCM10010094_05180 [Streptomyces flaveus]
MKRRGIAATFVALVAAGGLALGGCGAGDDESTPAPTEPTQTQEQQPEQGEDPQGGREDPQASERKDLVSFKLDDRSQAGLTNIWVTWTIKNNSSEKSNYTWDWEAVAPNGTRVANSTEFVADVQPGQTTTGEMFTTLKDTNVKLNITDFDRTKGF